MGREAMSPCVKQGTPLWAAAIFDRKPHEHISSSLELLTLPSGMCILYVSTVELFR